MLSQVFAEFFFFLLLDLVKVKCAKLKLDGVLSLEQLLSFYEYLEFLVLLVDELLLDLRGAFFLA